MMKFNAGDRVTYETDTVEEDGVVVRWNDSGTMVFVRFDTKWGGGIKACNPRDLHPEGQSRRQWKMQQAFEQGATPEMLEMLT
jgi:hypothetical protein